MKNRASNLLRAAYVDVLALVSFMCFLELCLERYILILVVIKYVLSSNIRC